MKYYDEKKIYEADTLLRQMVAIPEFVRNFTDSIGEVNEYLSIWEDTVGKYKHILTPTQLKKLEHYVSVVNELNHAAYKCAEWFFWGECDEQWYIYDNYRIMLSCLDDLLEQQQSPDVYFEARTLMDAINMMFINDNDDDRYDNRHDRAACNYKLISGMFTSLMKRAVLPEGYEIPDVFLLEAGEGDENE